MLPHLDAVLRYASFLERDRIAGEDLAQDTFLRAFRAWRSFEPGSDPRRWLFTICRNHFLSSRRSPRGAMESLDDPAVESVAFARLHNEVRREGADLLLARVDLAPAIRRGLAALPEEQRLTVALVDIEGLEYAEAAAALGTAVGTIRSRLFRGRRRLQELLIDHARDLGLAPRETLDGERGATR